MADSVFQNDYKSAQSWNMQGAIIYFTNCNKTGIQSTGGAKADSVENALIVNSMGITFGRGIQRIYPINISQAIQLIGIPEGSLSMGLMWGPGTAFRNFIECFKDSCASGNSGKAIHVVPFGKVCKDGEYESWGNSGELTIMSPVLASLGITVQSPQGNAIPVTASVGMSFMDLQLS